MLGRALLVEDSLARELTREFALGNRKIMLSHNLVVLLDIPRRKWQLIMDYLWTCHRRDTVDLRGTIQWCSVFAAAEQAEPVGGQLRWVNRSRWQRAQDWLANQLPRRLAHWLFDAPPLASGQHRVDAIAQELANQDGVLPFKARQEEG